MNNLDSNSALRYRIPKKKFKYKKFKTYSADTYNSYLNNENSLYKLKNDQNIISSSILVEKKFIKDISENKISSTFLVLQKTFNNCTLYKSFKKISNFSKVSLKKNETQEKKIDTLVKKVQSIKMIEQLVEIENQNTSKKRLSNENICLDMKMTKEENYELNSNLDEIKIDDEKFENAIEKNLSLKETNEITNIDSYLSFVQKNIY